MAASAQELALFTITIRWCIELFYGCTAVISICGNLLVICVLASCDGFTLQMRQLLINLALSDFFMALFSIPFTYSDFIYLQWNFPHSLCPIVHFTTITC